MKVAYDYTHEALVRFKQATGQWPIDVLRPLFYPRLTSRNFGVSRHDCALTEILSDTLKQLKE